jgi:hypothetical protein
VAVTHPDKERSFLSNYGHITRLSAEDILAQLPTRATPGDILLLCGTFLCTALLPDYPRLLATLRERGFQVAVDTGWPPHNWDRALREATTAGSAIATGCCSMRSKRLALRTRTLSRQRPAAWRRVSAAGAAVLSNAAPGAPGGGRQTGASRAGETGRGHRHHRRRRQF